jgi:Zn-dependent protease/CBS domain-containing protein
MEPAHDTARTRKKRGLGPGLTLARVGDFEIVADWSLLFVFALIVVNLGAAALPAWHPDWGIGMVWGVAVLAALLFFASILLHELSHVAVAWVYGIPVRGITLFLFGGMAHMKGEPPHPKAECLMAAAGPLTSLGIGAAATMLGAALAWPVLTGPLRDDPMMAARALGVLPTLLLWLGPLNVLLGIFNMLPGFPLDGGRVLRAILWWAWGDLRRATYWASFGGRMVAAALIATGVLMIFGVHVPIFGSGLQGLWLMLIGWFLHNAARASYTQMLLHESLRGLPVARLMFTAFESVEPELRITELVRRMMGGDQHCFVVVADGTLRGMVAIQDLRGVAQERWDDTTVEAIMTPAADLTVVSPDDDALAALERLADRDVEQLPVVAEDRVVGLFRRRDLVKWLGLWESAGRESPARHAEARHPLEPVG